MFKHMLWLLLIISKVVISAQEEEKWICIANMSPAPIVVAFLSSGQRAYAFRINHDGRCREYLVLTSSHRTPQPIDTVAIRTPTSEFSYYNIFAFKNRYMYGAYHADGKPEVYELGAIEQEGS